jgi:hypothetical protein
MIIGSTPPPRALGTALGPLLRSAPRAVPSALESGVKPIILYLLVALFIIVKTVSANKISLWYICLRHSIKYLSASN